MVWENSILISCKFFLSSSMSSSIFLNCFGEVCLASLTAFRSLSYPLESTHLLQSRAMFFPSVVIPLIAVSLRLVQLFVRCILQLHTMQQNVSSFFLIFCWQVSHTESVVISRFRVIFVWRGLRVKRLKEYTQLYTNVVKLERDSESKDSKSTTSTSFTNRFIVELLSVASSWLFVGSSMVCFSWSGF